MRVQEIALPEPRSALLACALTPAGKVVGFLGDDYPLPERGPRNTAHDLLIIGSREVPLSFNCIYPMVTALDEDSIVIVDARQRPGLNNAWLVRDGVVVASFSVGDAVAQVLSNRGHIATTYFDEGISSTRSRLSNEGVNAFSLSGEHVGGYVSKLAQFAVDIDDCYAACFDRQGRLLFCPYPEFPVVRIHLPSWRQEVWALPDVLHACQNIAATDTHAYFWNPGYERKDMIYAFDLESKEVTEVGKFPYLRSSQKSVAVDGRFINVEQRVVTIIDPSG